MYGWSRIVREMKKVDRGPERLGLQQKKERWLLQKDKQSLDLQESRVIKDQDGNVLTIEESRYLSAAPFRGRHSASSAFISVYPKHPSPFCVTCCVSILVTFNEKVSILTNVNGIAFSNRAACCFRTWTFFFLAFVPCGRVSFAKNPSPFGTIEGVFWGDIDDLHVSNAVTGHRAQASLLFLPLSCRLSVPP